MSEREKERRDERMREREGGVNGKLEFGEG